MQKSKIDTDSCETLEKNLAAEWTRQGKKLVHYCGDWDSMLICAEMPEICACTCDFAYRSHHEERKQAVEMHERSQGSQIEAANGDDGSTTDPESASQIFSPDGAPHSWAAR